NNWGPTLQEAGEPEMLPGASVSYNAFSLVGIKPRLGREFNANEAKPGAPKVALISHSLWQRRFNGDAAIVGKSVRLSGESYTIIGVLPQGFQLPIINGAEIFRTIGPTFSPGCQRGCYIIRVIARLKPGVTVERARAELTTIAQ